MSLREFQYSKINVVGTSGSGKSTFSKALAEITGHSYMEMDALFWGPDWYWPPDEEFFANLRNALKSESWILDGNYTRTIPIKWKAVELVIWVDYSFFRTLFQSIKRATIRSISGEEIWPGTNNRESFKKSFFSKESIILWSLKNYSSTKRKYAAMMEDGKYGHIDFVRLRSPKEAAALLDSIR